MKLYRYEAYNDSHHVELFLKEFVVMRETPCGYWVCLEAIYKLKDVIAGYDEKHKKWVSSSSRKRLCYPTKEEAYKSFKIRKDWHIRRLRAQLEIAEVAVNLTMENATIEKPDELCFEYE